MEWKADSSICECCTGRSEQLKHLKMDAANLPGSRVGPSGGRTLLRASLLMLPERMRLMVMCER